MIHYGRHAMTEGDIAAVNAALKGDLITQGPLVKTFERQLAQYCQARHAVAVNNGSTALYLACLALGLKPGGLLWTSPNSFIASANCALYCGAEVDFVDIDPSTGNMDMYCLEEKLIAARRYGRLPDIVVAVHFAGYSCDMHTLHRFAQQYRFRVVEDACHSLGGSYRDRKVGACTYSDMTVFSFHPVKSITTGEGGAVLCNRASLDQTTRLLANNGITRDLNTQHPDYRPWHYEQRALGINARLSEFQAALGISQLQRLDATIERRRALAEHYRLQLQSTRASPLCYATDRQPAWHLMSVHVGDNQGTVYNTLLQHGIQANVHYIPIHTQPYYQQMGFKWGDFPNSEAFYGSVLSLPLYAELEKKTVSRVCQVIAQTLACAV